MHASTKNNPMAGRMVRVGRVGRALALTALGAAASGCIVLPYGPGDGRYGRGHRHYAAPPVPAGAVIVVPQERDGHGRRR